MKKYLVFILIVTVAGMSCIKDRLQPAAQPVAVPHGDTLLYYWSFNGQDSSVRTPDYGVNAGAIFNYYCSYIDFTAGTPMGALNAADSGQALRLRNPSDSVIFYMSTAGYDSITLSFAEEASSSGPSQSALYYTTDGVHYAATALSNNVYTIATTYAQYTYSFASDPNVNNNPKFAIKMIPLNNNTGSSGNDRIDNVTLMGVRK